MFPKDPLFPLNPLEEGKNAIFSPEFLTLPNREKSLFCQIPIMVRAYLLLKK